MKSVFEKWLLTGLALSVLGATPALGAGLTISAGSVTVAPGSTGDVLEVDLTNGGPAAVTVGGFDFEISIANTNVSFTGANTSTTMTYIFSGDSLFSPNLTGPTSGQTISGSDVAFTPLSGTTLASGATVGLGLITFNVAANAAAGSFTVNLATYPSTSLSDALGNNLAISTYSAGDVTISAIAGVPEPSSLALLLSLAGVVAACKIVVVFVGKSPVGRTLRASGCLLGITPMSAVAQQATCMINVTAQLIDKDLNLKPVPKLRLELQREGQASQTLTTGFDGRLRAQAICGTYHLVSAKSSEFAGSTYAWDIPVVLAPGPETTVELSSDNAKVTASATATAAGTDELAALFKKYQNTVVTVWSEVGRGTGFFIDDQGLILTNQHVIRDSEYITVQFDERRKIRAVVLASDAAKDVAVLLADRRAFPEAISAPLAEVTSTDPIAVEGQRVFTIGSPLHQQKILTTGIVSKVEAKAIISDININHGNSGGPLFNSFGKVIGITTFGDLSLQGGPGVSGIVRIEQVMDVVSAAKAKRPSLTIPTAELLPVEPTIPFPIEALKTAAYSPKFDRKNYIFSEGDYHIELVTPISKYWTRNHGHATAAQGRLKRLEGKDSGEAPTFDPMADLKNWAEYVGEYQAVLQIVAVPTFGTKGGFHVGPRFAYKGDFYRMVLRCGGKEVTPIQPGKVMRTLFATTRSGRHAVDTAYEGFYTYPADAISPTCGDVELEVYSAKNVLQAKVREFSDRSVQKVWEDFGPYRLVTSK